MLNNLIVKLAIYVLKNTRFSVEQKNKVTGVLLEKLNAIPIRDIIKYDEQGKITINGKSLDIEQARNFLDSARVMKDNMARRIIQDQVLYHAMKTGVHEGLTPDMILFSKAAIWNQQQENRLLDDIIVD